MEDTVGTECPSVRDRPYQAGGSKGISDTQLRARGRRSPRGLEARIPWMICLWLFVTALQLNAQQKRPNPRSSVHSTRYRAPDGALDALNTLKAVRTACKRQVN